MKGIIGGRKTLLFTIDTPYIPQPTYETKDSTMTMDLYFYKSWNKQNRIFCHIYNNPLMVHRIMLVTCKFRHSMFLCIVHSLGYDSWLHVI